MKFSRRHAEPAHEEGGWHPDPADRFDDRWHDGQRWTEHVRLIRWDDVQGLATDTVAWIPDRAGFVLHWRGDRLTIAGPAGISVDVPAECCLGAELVEADPRAGSADIGLRLVLDLSQEPAGRGPEAVLTMSFAADQGPRLHTFQTSIAGRVRTEPLVHRPPRVAAGPPESPWVPVDRPPAAADGRRGHRSADTGPSTGRHHAPAVEDPDRADRRDQGVESVPDMFRTTLRTMSEPASEDDRDLARPEPVSTGPAAASARPERERLDPGGPPSLPRLAFRRLPDNDDWISFEPRPDSEEISLPAGLGAAPPRPTPEPPPGR